jgi:hypothetical protein
LNIAPFQIQASVEPFDIPEVSPQSITQIQKAVTGMMNASKVAGVTNRGDLPRRLTADFVVRRSTHEACDHVEMDLSTMESSRVVRYGKCTDLWMGGFLKLQSYRDGVLMTEREFEEWKEGCHATYRENRNAFRHTR